MQQTMKIADNGSWLNKTNEGQRFDVSLAGAIAEFCRAHILVTVLDLGCGDGSYVRYLNESPNIFMSTGVDGNPNTEILAGSNCWQADLSQPLYLPKPIDLIVSLEVGEHIPVEYESVFLDNVVKYAKKWIILSWAVPGQGGDGHINCRDNDYIIEKMAQRGFIINWEESFKLRAESSLSWFKNTLMVYEHIADSNDAQ
jgi:hypothetical protein